MTASSVKVPCGYKHAAVGGLRRRELFARECVAPVQVCRRVCTRLWSGCYCGYSITCAALICFMQHARNRQRLLPCQEGVPNLWRVGCIFHQRLASTELEPRSHFKLGHSVQRPHMPRTCACAVNNDRRSTPALAVAHLSSSFQAGPLHATLITL